MAPGRWSEAVNPLRVRQVPLLTVASGHRLRVLMRLLFAYRRSGVRRQRVLPVHRRRTARPVGHQATVFAPRPARGLRRRSSVASGSSSMSANLPREIDAAITQDAAVSLQLADRMSADPQLFVAHSGSFDRPTPPQLPGFVGRVVVLNGRVEAPDASLDQHRGDRLDSRWTASTSPRGTRPQSSRAKPFCEQHADRRRCDRWKPLRGDRDRIGTGSTVRQGGPPIRGPRSSTPTS